MRDKKKMHLHFAGIGGIGMSGIAQVLHNQGYRVSGSDLQESETVKKLKQLGIQVKIGHDASHLGQADVLVISSAVQPDNPEVLEARRLRIPVIPRAEMLAELMRGKTGIAIAGSHGKTTTTSLVATILTEAGLDPTLVIGGRVDSLGGNAKLGQGEFLVAEADESDGSFLQLPASYAIVTNIDNDHLDHFGSLAALEESFVQFIGKLPFFGLGIVCGDDPGVRRCISRFSKPICTYGKDPGCDYTLTHIDSTGMGSRFEIFSNEKGKGLKICEIGLQIPGEHNALNALAAVVMGLKLGIPVETIRKALKKFTGVKRRFEIRYQDSKRQIVVIDDYGHHPTEIAATLAAARKFWPGRILTVFQPHRYTRTLLCRDGFRSAFQYTDLLFICDIYSAGEQPIQGVSAEALIGDIRQVILPPDRVRYSGSLERSAELLKHEIQDGDLVLCLGAGTITRLPDHLIDLLSGETP